MCTRHQLAIGNVTPHRLHQLHHPHHVYAQARQWKHAPTQATLQRLQRPHNVARRGSVAMKLLNALRPALEINFLSTGFYAAGSRSSEHVESVEAT